MTALVSRWYSARGCRRQTEAAESIWRMVDVEPDLYKKVFFASLLEIPSRQFVRIESENRKTSGAALDSKVWRRLFERSNWKSNFEVSPAHVVSKLYNFFKSYAYLSCATYKLSGWTFVLLARSFYRLSVNSKACLGLKNLDESANWIRSEFRIWISDQNFSLENYAFPSSETCCFRWALGRRFGWNPLGIQKSN